MTPPFDPNKWASTYNANAARSERNSLMDSGWSAAEAEQCTFQHHLLLSDLLTELRKVKLKPEDFFDRPELAAVLAAVAGIKDDPLA